MPGGLTLRGRGYRLVAQIESGLHSQAGIKKRGLWTKSTPAGH